MEILMIVIVILGVIVTPILGITKHRAFEGIVAGLFLSWIGFIWLLLQKPKIQCAECASWIVKGIKRCPKCRELVSQ